MIPQMLSEKREQLNALVVDESSPQPQRPGSGEPYQRVYSRLFEDQKYLAQSSDTRNVWRYILECPERLTEGFYRLDTRLAARRIGIEEHVISDALLTLSDLEVIYWDEAREQCLILKALFYQGTTNPNGAQSVVNKVSTLNNDFFIARLWAAAVEFKEIRLLRALEAHFDKFSIDPYKILSIRPISEHAGNNPQQPATTRQQSTPTPSPPPSLSYSPLVEKAPFVVNGRFFDEIEESA